MLEGIKFHISIALMPLRLIKFTAFIAESVEKSKPIPSTHEGLSFKFQEKDCLNKNI